MEKIKNFFTRFCSMVKSFFAQNIDKEEKFEAQKEVLVKEQIPDSVVQKVDPYAYANEYYLNTMMEYVKILDERFDENKVTCMFGNLLVSADYVSVEEACSKCVYFKNFKTEEELESCITRNEKFSLAIGLKKIKCANQLVNKMVWNFPILNNTSENRLDEIEQ